jgi:hypothetical protein
MRARVRGDKNWEFDEIEVWHERVNRGSGKGANETRYETRVRRSKLGRDKLSGFTF